MQRQSLLDGDDYSGIGNKRGGKGSGGGGGTEVSNKNIKLIVAAVLFVLAGGLLAWNFGLIGGKSADPHAAPPPTRQQVEQREEQAKEAEAELEQLQRDGKATVGGA
jgi:hypothetical protein